MSIRLRTLFVIGVVTAMLAGLVGPSAARMTRWENFGVGWVNAGFSHAPEVEVPMNGDGNHAGQLRIASSSQLFPDRIRIRVTSEDAEPVPISVWYLWLGCTTAEGDSWSRDLSYTIEDFTPPWTLVIYDSAVDGPVEGCHVNVEMSTTLFDDGLHHFKVKLQARRSLS